jgi:hypothetical protein
VLCDAQSHGHRFSLVITARVFKSLLAQEKAIQQRRVIVLIELRVCAGIPMAAQIPNATIPPTATHFNTFARHV